MDANTIQGVGYGVGLLILGGVTAYREWRRKKDRADEVAMLKKYGLEDNPTRCLEHTQAIGGLREDVAEIHIALAVQKTLIDGIAADVTELKHK